MKIWRLNWTIDEVLTPSNYTNHNKALKSSWKFWLTLVLKFVPNVWKNPILLRLKDGGAFFVKDFMTLYIYKEVFVDKCYDSPALTEEYPVIVDIGANSGLFALRMKQLYPNASIYCFEPFKTNFKQLNDNIKVSNLDNIAPFQFGIGGVTRMERLYIHNSNVGGHSIIQSLANSTNYTEIEIVSIKEVFENLKITKCNLLKIDCEGAELEIIKNIDHKIAATIEKIIFEPTPSVYNVSEVLDHLQTLGFVMVEREGLYIGINSQNADAIFLPHSKTLVA
jgi:FkbM family methyltransferase